MSPEDQAVLTKPLGELSWAEIMERTQGMSGRERTAFLDSVQDAKVTKAMERYFGNMDQQEIDRVVSEISLTEEQIAVLMRGGSLEPEVVQSITNPLTLGGLTQRAGESVEDFHKRVGRVTEGGGRWDIFNEDGEYVAPPVSKEVLEEFNLDTIGKTAHLDANWFQSMVEAMIEEEMGSRRPTETEEEYENRRWASEAKVLQNLSLIHI